MHAGALQKSAQAALAILSKSDILRRAYIAGGTALALQLGHRESYDFDFYTPQDIRAEDVVSHLATLGKFTTTLLEPPHTILGVFKGVKFSLFRYTYPLIKVPKHFLGVAIASLDDVACMKLSAICGRATKRDYVDIYTITKQIAPIEKQLGWYEKKFGPLGNNLYVIIKALGYFEDAEGDEMPRMLTPLTWDEVKTFLTAESIRLGKKVFR